MLKLFGFKKVNEGARGYTRDLRVLWALEEMQIPFEIVGIDHPAGDLNKESYHKMNPFDQVPVIDDEGVVLSESGAILIYLAKKSGKLIPKDFAGESQVVRWCFAALNSVEIPLMSYMMMNWTSAPDEGKKHREFLLGWSNRHLGNLDGWLKHREHIATDSFTVADILMAHVLAGVKDESVLKPFKNVVGYRDRCLGRASWKRTMENYLKNVKPG